MAEQPRAHGGAGLVDYLEEGDPAGPGSKRLYQLEVAPGHLINPEMALRAPHRGAAQVRQSTGLQLAQIPEQCPRRAKRGLIFRPEAEAVQRGELEAARQLSGGKLGIELPPLPRRLERAFRGAERMPGWEHHFRRRKAAERLGESVGAN